MIKCQTKRNCLPQLLFVCVVCSKSVFLTIALYFRRKLCGGAVFNEIDLEARFFGASQIVEVIVAGLGILCGIAVFCKVDFREDTLLIHAVEKRTGSSVFHAGAHKDIAAVYDARLLIAA